MSAEKTEIRYIAGPARVALPRLGKEAVRGEWLEATAEYAAELKENPNWELRKPLKKKAGAKAETA
jgi:hypothetical protein